MFESPASTRFFADPWAVSYGTAFDVEAEDPEDEPAGAPPDPFVETDDWTRGIWPAPVTRPAAIAFVDGVQRIEMWGRVPHGDLLLEAALASVAVGASVCTDRSAEVTFEPPSRVLAVGSSASVDSLRVTAGHQSLTFEAETSQRLGRDGVNDAIRKRRSEMERALAERLTSKDTLVVLDGRLSFDPGRATPVVGFAKTIHRFYLEEPERSLIFKLQACQRTPVFRISYGDTTRYSWYLRLPNTRPIHHALAGVVRLETPEIGERDAIALANLTAYHLPSFASKPQHDPRAPQNLLPVGGLERRLRHEMGDAAFLRRAIEDQLARDLQPVASS
jgi:hypothetical protein